jgi:type IV secretion system protein VirB7
MIRLLCAVLATGACLAIAGCGTLVSIRPPSCDGYARRPLNRSLWDWETAKLTAAASVSGTGSVHAAAVPEASTMGSRSLKTSERVDTSIMTVGAGRHPGATKPSSQAATQARAPVYDVAGSYGRCG